MVAWPTGCCISRHRERHNAPTSGDTSARARRVVILDKQVADRDSQIASLRERISEVHASHGGADQRSHDLSGQLRAAEQRGANLAARVQLLQTQLDAAAAEGDGMRVQLGAEKAARHDEVAKAADARRDADAALSLIHI